MVANCFDSSKHYGSGRRRKVSSFKHVSINIAFRRQLFVLVDQNGILSGVSLHHILVCVGS